MVTRGVSQYINLLGLFGNEFVNGTLHVNVKNIIFYLKTHTIV